MSIFSAERSTDVIVIGGGPAGSATAIALAHLGRSVTILERYHYESTRIGETLPPEIKRPLIELGVWPQFLADDPLEAPGILAAWGREALYENDFIVNPHGHGWHVDRRRFDAMLSLAAANAGAEVVQGAGQISVVHDLLNAAVPQKTTRSVEDGIPTEDHVNEWNMRTPLGEGANVESNGWFVRAEADGYKVELQAPVLVDATGRSASPVRYLAGHRMVHDRLVGLVGFIVAEGGVSDRRTLIEALECGWWYAAPLPNGNHVAVFMSDADLLPQRTAATASFWRDQLRQSVHTRARLGQGDSIAGVRLVAACSSCACVAASRDWLAVGDAAAAFDPLSSQGLAWALESGLMAATAIDGHLGGHQQALADYALQVQSEFTHYLEMRAIHYGREQRWPDSPFWRRRHASWYRDGSMNTVRRLIGDTPGGRIASRFESPREGGPPCEPI
jgi:flavin-dependent dehydrogenase